MLVLPGTKAKLKNKITKSRTKIAPMLVKPGQMTVSDKMFIASACSPYFANATCVQYCFHPAKIACAAILPIFLSCYKTCLRRGEYKPWNAGTPFRKI
jgi:hypothetical protein